MVFDKLLFIFTGPVCNFCRLSNENHPGTMLDLFMRKILALAFLIISFRSAAQDSLKVYNNSRNQTTATGMKILGSWGLANVAAGAAGWGVSGGGQNRHFYQMTTIWGGGNFAVAIP